VKQNFAKVSYWLLLFTGNFFLEHFLKLDLSFPNSPILLIVFANIFLLRSAIIHYDSVGVGKIAFFDAPVKKNKYWKETGFHFMEVTSKVKS